ncbi:polymorphic toxin-type HINT domain-containing protein [Streptomyces sp. NPDC058067]|uniref:polymorphic toxin-type HINT domain-containing protein n=1 Tax=Streptomyces sp. NPDC058067 TaxID=3346324 RepID=UPI0036E01CA0
MSLGLAGALLAGLLSTVSVVSPQEAGAADDPIPAVPSQSLGPVPPQRTEEVGKPLPAPDWPSAAEASVDLSNAGPGDPGTVTPAPSPSATGDSGTQVGEVVEVAPVRAEEGTTAQLSASRRLSEDASPTPDPNPSDSPSAGPGESPSPTPGTTETPSAEPSASPAPDPLSPDKVDVRVLDRTAVEPAGGVGLGLQVTRTDGVDEPGQVQVDIDYSGFKYAYGGEFASRLRLVKLPSCALETPQAEGCTEREFIEAENDTATGTLTATVTAEPDEAGVSTQLGSSTSGASVYALTAGSSSDQGDYRASTLSPTGSWDVSTGSGAFTYNLPIQLPKPPMGSAPPLAMSYNSQSVDGRTSASNNQASWVGMGWDLNVGYIERRYRNCTQDGLPTIGDMCWDSPNSAKEPSGAVYVINLNGVTSELIQDNNGTGAYHLQADPGWRVQRLFGGYGAGRDGEYWVISTQDGQRYYFGWGRSERTSTATASVFTVPVVGNDAGEPCHDQFPEPCTQAWRWNLDRAVDANEVETMYFYDKEYNHYRSVANTDKARSYVSSGYVKEIQYGWSSQMTDGQLPAKVELTHVNRCIERMSDNDPLRSEPPACPTFKNKPGSYPDVPIDLMCDGTSADYNCAGKTYYPTFFSTDMLWDIKTYVRDNDAAGWELVEQFQTKHGLPNPDGSVGKTLWLDYLQRKTYGTGTDIVLPVINFNGVDLDNKVGSTELNFRRVSEIHGDTGATTTVSYGFANPCTADTLPSQATNTKDCFWQKWTPEGATDAKSGWFKKFLVTKVEVDPTVTTNQEGAPVMTTSYTYEDGAGWRFTNDPLTPDDDESWSDWRGYQETQVTTGADTGKSTKKYWLYRGLSGDRTSKTDPSATKTVTVDDGDGNNYTDHAWLAGQVLSTSLRDDANVSHERTYHAYWDHNTAQYDGLPDARFVRESKTTTNTKISTGWREHVVENEYVDTENASTTFGLPMRTDDWGESNVSDNRCTTYGRAYNTDNYDSTGAQRWMVSQDQVKHYSVGCSSIADSNQDGYTSTLYDNSTSVDTNHPVDGNPTEVRSYTKVGSYRTVKTGYDKAGRVVWSEDGKTNHTAIKYDPENTWPLNGVTTTSPDPDGSLPAATGTPLISTVWMSRFWGLPTTTKDANGSVTKVTLDAAGRAVELWRPTETGTSPSQKYAYSIPTSTNGSGVPDSVDGYPHVTTSVLQSGNTYLTGHAYSDALGRPRETQAPLPDDINPATGQNAHYRQVSVTRYDSAGRVAGTSAVFRNLGTAGSGGPSSPEYTDLPSYNDVKVDWAGRTVLSQLMVYGAKQLAGKVITAYDGDFTSVQPAVGGATDTYSDVYGQTAKVVEHDGTSTYSTQYGYTAKGELEKITDTRGNNTLYGYDWAGQRISTDDPDAGKSTTVYDANGQIQQTTSNYDQAGIGQTVVNYGYDNLGRKTGVTSGSTQLASWQWDGVTGGKGHVTQSISRDASGNTYTTKIGKFDSRGRPTESTVTIPANVTGLAGSYTTTVAYNAADAVTSVTHPAAGGLPAETVTTAYDDYGRPWQLTSNLNGSVYVGSTAYDDYGRLIQRLYGPEIGGTGVNAVRDYAYNDTDGTRQLQSIVTTTSINELTSEQQKDTYRYDLAGRITELREQASGKTAQSQCFIYDDLGRLSNGFTRSAEGQCAAFGVSDFTGTAPYQTGYAYDRLGNLQSITDTDAAGKATKHDYLYPGYDDAGTWTTPNTDQPHGIRKTNNTVSGVATSTDTFHYTADGQMDKRVEPGTSSADAKTTDYTWTKLGQLETVKTTKSSGQELTRYTYDADGNLIVRTSPQETVAYLGGMELRTTNGTTVTATRYYTCGTSAVAMRTTGPNGGKVTFLMADTQASTQVAIDAGTGAATRRRYTPFGDERSGTLPTGTDRGFLGKTEDSTTGLSLLGARAYDPKLGQFLSPDPLSTPYDPQNLSGFAYSRNNPINYSDPTGLALKCGGPGEEACPHGNPMPQGEGTNTRPAAGNAGGGSGSGSGGGSSASGSGGGGGFWDIDWRQAAAEVAGVAAAVTVGVLCESAAIAAAPETAGASLLATSACGAAAGAAASSVTNFLDEDEESVGDVVSDTLDSAAFGAVVGPAAEIVAGKLAAGRALSKGCKNSFTPEAKVELADHATKPIKRVKVGDKILATDPETGRTESRTVLATIITKEDKNFVELSVHAGKNDGAIVTTTHHPFWSVSRHAWTDAGDLKQGMTLRTDAGLTATVQNVRTFHQVQETRNLTIDGLHTYYVLAGSTPVLVHNCTVAPNLHHLPTSQEAQDIIQNAPRGSSAAKKSDPYHRAPIYMQDQIAENGTVWRQAQRDPMNPDTMLHASVPGEVNGKSGIFHWIVDPRGVLVHEAFEPRR